MKRMKPETTHCGIIVILIAFLLLQINVDAQDRSLERSLEGVWQVRTIPRNCTTGEPIPAAAFEALYTFHRDRKMTSWYSSGTPSPGQGLWRSELGWRDYSFRLVRILRTPTMVYSGKQEIGGTLTLNESGDLYTSDEYMIVYSIDGVPSTPACINSVGTRFTME
jgi:hypothetical protein